MQLGKDTYRKKYKPLSSQFMEIKHMKLKCKIGFNLYYSIYVI